MTVDKLVSGLRKKISISGLVLLLGVGGFVGYDRLSEHSKEKNLSPNAFWCGGNQFETQYGKAFLKNKDLDGDGSYESVIRYVDKEGKYHELEMRLNKDGFPQIIYPAKE